MSVVIYGIYLLKICIHWFYKRNKLKTKKLKNVNKYETRCYVRYSATDNSFASRTVYVPKQYGAKAGDVNFDGHVNAVDASAVLSHYAAISTDRPSELTDSQARIGDMDGDGNTNAVDASIILEIYAFNSIGRF